MRFCPSLPGLKDSLFHEYLLEDVVYLGVAVCLIVFLVLCYTQSFFLTLATFLSILYSLSLAYFIYSFVLGIDFFPFMNLLAAVIAIGKPTKQPTNSIARILKGIH